MLPLTQIKRRPVEEVVGALRAESEGQSKEAGVKLVNLARAHGLGLRDYLTLAIDTRAGEHAERVHGLEGFEAALAHLNLPIRDDYVNGITLQAASETFQTYPGTRAMFPEVIDQMLRWTDRQDQMERVEPMLAQTRTISGIEMLSTVVDDDSAERDSHPVPELARIPVRSIRTTENAVKMYKHGSAYRTSYEFNRRASLDLLTPYAARVMRELEVAKVKAATHVLINGDGVHPAATVKAITTFGGTAGTLDYKSLAKWIMASAKAGRPIDTIVGNYDMWVEMLMLFTPTLAGPGSLAGTMPQVAGTPALNLNLPILNRSVNFVLSSAAPDNQLIGYVRGETMEQLVEGGSQIAENERSIVNQSITYVRTEVSGFRLAWGDTREILNVAA